MPGWSSSRATDHGFWYQSAEEWLGEVQEFLTGARAVPDADRVLATVLFTDIVDSTRAAADLGDRRWREVLERHQREVREALGRFNGREVKSTGDGFLATFDGPARAIHCATAILRSSEASGIGVRAGLHTGECEVMGDDIGGIAVHIAARVSARAEPRELLVSRTVKDLVAGSGIQFTDRGAHALKGVPDTWQLYAVDAWLCLAGAAPQHQRASRAPSPGPWRSAKLGLNRHPGFSRVRSPVRWASWAQVAAVFARADESAGGQRRARPQRPVEARVIACSAIGSRAEQVRCGHCGAEWAENVSVPSIAATPQPDWAPLY